MNYDLKHFAYIGDCVWELFIREKIIKKTKILQKMHSLTTSFVNAQSQANILDVISDILTEEELEIQRRGRNLKISINKKSNPKIHSLATSFEVLIGYWYMENKERLKQVFSVIEERIKI